MLPITLETQLDAFDVAWQNAPAPRLEAFFAIAPALERPRLLEELVKIDLEYRWRQAVALGDALGGKPLLEAYRRSFPQLGLSAELIAEEYRVRQWWGDRPAHAEYLRRFPAIALIDLLRRVDDQIAAESVREAPATLAVSWTEDATPQDLSLPLQAVSVSSMVAMIGRCRLVSTEQSAELTDRWQRSFADPKALARALLARDWLTPYQVNHLLQGRESDLVLGPYVLLERLGDGGTGWVFKARHQHLRRLVALKVLRRELLANPDVLARFYREIQVVSQLAHPHVVLAYDAGPIDDMHVLVMEYAAGIDLARLIKRSGPLPVPRACAYVRQAALGLQHIHERGQLHRDVKPSNLLLTEGSHPATQPQPAKVGSEISSGKRSLISDSCVKVLDLGLAGLGKVAPAGELGGRLPGGSSARLTPDGAIVVGTPDYLAPEQAADFHQADVRADVYSLGCTFYFLLTGQPPFPGGSLAKKLLRHEMEEPPDIRSARPDATDRLAGILRRMLAKDPSDRYQSMAEVAAALDSLASARPPWRAAIQQLRSRISSKIFRREPKAVSPPEQAKQSPVVLRDTRHTVHKKKVLIVLLAALGLGAGVWACRFKNHAPPTGVEVAQPRLGPTALPTLFSTGAGTHSGADPHWVIGAAPAPMFWKPAQVTRMRSPAHALWLANGPASRWISPQTDQGHGELPGTYTYQTTFDLHGFDPATLRLAALVAADNDVIDVRLNGRSLQLKAHGFSAFTRLTVAGRFLPQINTLEFVVENTGRQRTPSGLRVEFTALAVPIPDPSMPYIANAGFESPQLGGGPLSYGYATHAGWTFGGDAWSGSGITANGNAFTSGNPAAPDGQQVAFLQGAGHITQTVQFPAGTYTLSFKAAQRGNYQASLQDFLVLVDSRMVSSYCPVGTAYREYMTSGFTVSAGAHVIQFKGLNSRGGDNTVFLDAVRLQASK